MDASVDLTPSIAPIAAPVEVGCWLSISELAASKGVTKQAISQRVAALRLETKKGARGAKLVNLAAFEVAVAEAGDPVKEQGADTKGARVAPAAGSAPGDSGAAKPEYRTEATRKAGFEADLKEIELGKELGRYVPVEEVEAAMVRCGEAIVRIIDRMPSYAAEVVGAVDKDREAGARGVLKTIARTVREALAAELKHVAAGDDTPAAPTAPL